MNRMRHWPFHLAAALIGLTFFLDLKFSFLNVSPVARLSLLAGASLVLLLPYIDGVMGRISKLKWTFKPSEGGSLEIERKVAHAEQAAENAEAAVVNAFPSMPAPLQPSGVIKASGEPWRELRRISEQIVRRLAERIGEDPELLVELPLSTSIDIAHSKGGINSKQADALKSFFEVRQTLAEICLRLREATPISIQAKAQRLVVVGDSLVSSM